MDPAFFFGRLDHLCHFQGEGVINRQTIDQWEKESPTVSLNSSWLSNDGNDDDGGYDDDDDGGFFITYSTPPQMHRNSEKKYVSYLP